MCKAQGDTCALFHTGRFVYNDSLNSSKVITRSGKRQTDHDSRTGVTIRSTIRWISNCSYELKQVWSNDKAQRKNNRSVTRIRISKIYSNGYAYTCECGDKIISGELIRVGE